MAPTDHAMHGSPSERGGDKPSSSVEAMRLRDLNYQLSHEYNRLRALGKEHEEHLAAMQILVGLVADNGLEQASETKYVCVLRDAARIEEGQVIARTAEAEKVSEQYNHIADRIQIEINELEMACERLQKAVRSYHRRVSKAEQAVMLLRSDCEGINNELARLRNDFCTKKRQQAREQVARGRLAAESAEEMQPWSLRHFPKSINRVVTARKMVAVQKVH